MNVATLAGVTALITITGMLPVLNAFDITPAVFTTISGMFLSQLVFFALGALCAVVFKKNKIGSIVSYLIVISTYALAVVIQYIGNINFLNALTPFRYFIATEVSHAGLNPLYIIIALAVTGVVLTFSALKYKDRELLI